MHRTRNTVGGVVLSIGAFCLVSIFKQFPKLPVRLTSIRIVPYYRVWVQSWVLAATLTYGTRTQATALACLRNGASNSTVLRYAR
jgi:hypothetical protein